jgi:Lon protease-like protein
MPYCHNCGYPTDELKRQADYESTPEYRRRQVEAARERYEQKLGEVEEQALKRHEERAWEKVLERQRKHIEEAMEETKPESKLVNAIVYLLCFAGYAFVAFAIYHGCTGP